MNIINILKNKLNNKINTKDIEGYGFQNFRFRVKFKDTESKNQFLDYLNNNKNEGIIYIIRLGTLTHTIEYKNILKIFDFNNYLFIYFSEIKRYQPSDTIPYELNLKNISEIKRMINYDSEKYNIDSNLLISIYKKEREKYGYIEEFL